jgi:hypothetical protein
MTQRNRRKLSKIARPKTGKRRNIGPIPHSAGNNAGEKKNRPFPMLIVKPYNPARIGVEN